jgi:25S rRNA (cytosine2870-C5)-methyltransferase
MSESDSGSEMRELSSYGDESGEKKMINDEFDGESGEQEMSEGEQKDVVDEEFDAGSYVREEGSDEEGEAGVENKRDEVIQQLLSKDDIAMITARISETVKILGNFKELRDPDTARNDYLESLKNDI